MPHPIIGAKHGRLTILELIRGGRHPKVRCRCDCGVEKTIQRDNLSRTHSCGCLKRELTGAKNRSHGLSHTAEWHIWSDMKGRCSRPSTKDAPYYRERGLTVCRRWIDSFRCFYEDMGPRPSPRHSIDRIDNDQGYRPDNCRWATAREQRLNQRRQFQPRLAK